MALPIGRSSAPIRRFDTGGTDYELYEEDGEFVLSIEMPGFDREEITLSWDAGVLTVAAEREERGERRTVYRRFRFPRSVDEETIEATYSSGILELRLPVADSPVRGKEIEVRS